MSVEQLATTSSGLRIRSQQGDYDVRFFDGAHSLGESLGALSDTYVLADETVRRLYPALFTVFEADRVLTLPATEEAKTLAGVERVVSFIQRGGASRASTLIVVGGGIIQDIGTFAAHIYFRGIPYVFVPTTLLSMADSCIGAKCGVNLGSFKNQLGFFQSPSRVAIWPGFLRTLPPDDVRSGFGEVLKLSITAGDEAFTWFEELLGRQGFEISSVRDAIERSLQTKRAVIEEDEYERNIRKTLNYGHTFGHALESVTKNEIPHGLAVAWGVDVANFVASATGLLDPSLQRRMHHLIARHFSFEARHEYNATTLLAAMQRDKKAASGSVSLILPRGLGHLEIVPTAIDDVLGRHVANYIERDDICSLID